MQQRSRITEVISFHEIVFHSKSMSTVRYEHKADIFFLCVVGMLEKMQSVSETLADRE